MKLRLTDMKTKYNRKEKRIGEKEKAELGFLPNMKMALIWLLAFDHSIL